MDTEQNRKGMEVDSHIQNWIKQQKMVIIHMHILVKTKYKIQAAQIITFVQF